MQPEHAEGTFAGTGGLNLYFQAWRPTGVPRAVVTVVHGVAEHSGRYPNVVGHLVPQGHAVYAYDHRGHGRSPGLRVHVNRWDEYREDLQRFLAMVATLEPGRPLFVYGHSMGALVVLDYLLFHQDSLRGAVLSAAPLEPVGVAKPYLVALARLLSPVWPRFTVRTRLDVPVISRDPAVVRAYREDPLVYGAATVRWGTETLGAVARVKANLPAIRLPVLLIHGGADRISSPDGSRLAYERVSSADKTLHIYAGTYHEPHNDVNHEEVLRTVAQWLDRHT